jgi:ribonuclease P protein component
VTWRVRGRAEFAALSRARRHARGPLSVRVRAATPETSAEPPRIAFSVGRNVGPAVVRNRVRRRLRAAVRQSPEYFEAGCAYLIGAGPAAAELAYLDLQATLRACLPTSSADGVAPTVLVRA